MSDQQEQGKHLIFVYGTLKRGFPNYDSALKNARYLGEFITVEAYPLIIGSKWFVPSLLPEKGCGERVAGELFEVNSPCLTQLDELEGVAEPNGYRRGKIDIESVDGGGGPCDLHRVEAWVYFRRRNRAGAIHSGVLQSYSLDQRYVLTQDRETWDDL